MDPRDHVLDYKSRVPKPRPRGTPLYVLILVLLAALLMILLVSIPVKTGRVDAARRASTIAVIANLSSAIDEFKKDVGRYPTNSEGLDALLRTPPGVAGWRGPYIDGVPTDRWGHDYRYVCPVDGDPSKFDIVSAGPDGDFGTADDINRTTR